jgi:hypothetical protein
MFTILDGGEGDVLGLEISGGYTKNDVAAFVKAFEEVREKGHAKVNLLVRIDRMVITESEFGAFVEDARYALKHLKEMGRIAVVGKSEIQNYLVKLDNLLIGDPKEGLVEKYFDVADLDEAWAFVRG